MVAASPPAVSVVPLMAMADAPTAVNCSGTGVAPRTLVATAAAGLSSMVENPMTSREAARARNMYVPDTVTAGRQV